MKKTDSISPLGEQERGKKMCDSTVAVCALPPPPSWAVLYSILQEGVGGVRPNRCVSGDTRDIGPHPQPQTTIMIANLKGAKDVLSFCPNQGMQECLLQAHAKTTTTNPTKTRQRYQDQNTTHASANEKEKKRQVRGTRPRRIG